MVKGEWIYLHFVRQLRETTLLFLCSLGTGALPNTESLLEVRIRSHAPNGANYFLLEFDPIDIEDKTLEYIQR